MRKDVDFRNIIRDFRIRIEIGDISKDSNIACCKRRRNFNADAVVFVELDGQSMVRKKGNAFMNYDFQNRGKRIGSVYMNYNRFALTQVGGIQLFYNFNPQLITSVGFV